MRKYRSEWKYCIDETLLNVIRERLSAVLDRDIHAKENGIYEIHSMYFDDYNDTCAQENLAGDGIRFKYRIRYYNDNTERIMLEKKCKNNTYCYKRSCRISKEEYYKILEGNIGEMYWKTEEPLLREFYTNIMTKYFRPKIIVNYEREAFVEPINNVRVTFDCAVSASDSFDSFMENDYFKLPILPERKSILEVKFDDVLPAYIRNALQYESVNQQSFSKYVMSRKAMQDYLRIN